MSDKFFFKGRKTPKPKHESYGYNTKRVAKLGSESNPLELVVNTEVRESEIKLQLLEHKLMANITVDVNASEDVGSLEQLLIKEQPVISDKKPDRNQVCPCGSGHKYKKCCGK